jgi:hypothetical protein
MTMKVFVTTPRELVRLAMPPARKCRGAVILLALAAACLAGCQSNGQLSPTVSADVNTVYTDLCAALPALGPISGTLNGQLQNDYAQAVKICAAGSPTNPIVAGLDILAIDAALAPYFAK